MAKQSPSRTQKVLFLSHSAARSGAPILLLHLLRWLKGQAEFQYEVIVRGGGDLLDEFRAVAPTRVWRGLSYFPGLIPGRWRVPLAARWETLLLRSILRKRQYDLVYVNTVANWQQVPFLATRSKSILWHIHELEYALRVTMGGEGWRHTFPLADRFIAVSSAVRDTLCRRFDVPEEKVDLVHAFVPFAKPSPEDYRRRRQRVRRELGLGDNAFVVGGCGSLGWRKGTDLFLQIARIVQEQKRQNTHFLWVGSGLRKTDALEFTYDIGKLGLKECAHWVPNTPNAADYYCAMDVFALTSREDPFPLVMLEAGACGLPLVCFANSGGGPEFADGGAGLVVPYLNTAAFAAQLVNLQTDADLRHRLGAEAARRVQCQHTVEIQGPKLLQSIERCLAGR